VPKQTALEILEAYQREVRRRTDKDCHAQYCIDWKNVELFATCEIMHLDLTVHQMLENFHLTIEIGCLEDMGSEATLNVLGIPGSVGRLNKLIDALSLLSKEKPRPVTFALKDFAKASPSNMEYVLRKLSIPFHRLRSRGFAMGVTYANYRYGEQSGCGEWNLGDDGWKWPVRATDVWNWSLHDWNINFTRANQWFQPRSLMGDSFYPNPNGPLERYDRGFMLAKIHV
jgi:hypothetical protein